jgi:hypothetical protein
MISYLSTPSPRRIPCGEKLKEGRFANRPNYYLHRNINIFQYRPLTIRLFKRTQARRRDVQTDQDSPDLKDGRDFDYRKNYYFVLFQTKLVTTHVPMKPDNFLLKMCAFFQARRALIFIASGNGPGYNHFPLPCPPPQNMRGRVGWGFYLLTQGVALGYNISPLKGEIIINHHRDVCSY